MMKTAQGRGSYRLAKCGNRVAKWELKGAGRHLSMTTGKRSTFGDASGHDKTACLRREKDRRPNGAFRLAGSAAPNMCSFT
jgi:hypothetical protein